MSEFKVDVRIVESVEKHPNADLLDIIKLKDLNYEIISQKGLRSVGQYVVYFPIDSLLPDNLIDKFGIRNYLGGKAKNRIRMAKIRDKYSEGFICTFEDIKDLLPQSISNDIEYYSVKEQDLVDHNVDLSTVLGVVKYDPPQIATNEGNLRRLPQFVDVYDIESCDRFKKVYNYLYDNDIPCYVTEKLEGTNIAIAYNAGNDETFVCSHYNDIENIEGQEIKYTKDGVEHTRIAKRNKYWDAAIEGNFIYALKAALAYYDKVKQITLRGELIGPGIQGNIYKLTKPEIRLFDIKFDNDYLGLEQIKEVIRVMGYDFNEVFAPILWENQTLKFIEQRSGNISIKEISNGKSQLNLDTLAEGIVIKPMNELKFDQSRVILKQRSPEYLLKYEK